MSLTNSTTLPNNGTHADWGTLFCHGHPGGKYVLAYVGICSGSLGFGCGILLAKFVVWYRKQVKLQQEEDSRSESSEVGGELSMASLVR